MAVKRKIEYNFAAFLIKDFFFRLQKLDLSFQAYLIVLYTKKKIKGNFSSFNQKFRNNAKLKIT